MATMEFRPSVSFASNTYTLNDASNLRDGNFSTYAYADCGGYALQTAAISIAALPTGATITACSVNFYGRINQFGSVSVTLSAVSGTSSDSSSISVNNTANGKAYSFGVNATVLNKLRSNKTIQIGFADAGTSGTYLIVYEFYVTVTYTLPTYAITANAGAGGSISPSGSTTVTQGNSQTYTITPDEGYLIADVAVDGASVGAVSSYTFTNVTAAHTIAASFAVAFDKSAQFRRRRERWL